MTLKVYELWNVIKAKQNCLFQIDWKNNIPNNIVLREKKKKYIIKNSYFVHR